ncbi:MAG: hypothetical protein ACFWTY_06690 [Shouchella clausii]
MTDIEKPLSEDILARLNGNCPYAEKPSCLTCNGGKPCKDLAVGLSEMDAAKYEIHIQSTSKMIEVARQYGREEILEKNQKNLERSQDIYNTIKHGNIIFGRLEQVKRKQGKVLQMTEYDRKEHLKRLHEERKDNTRKKVDNAIQKLIRANSNINFNSVAEEAGISKDTLYNNPEIRKRIESLREQLKFAYAEVYKKI